MKSRLSELSFNIIMQIVTGKRYFGDEVVDFEEAKRFREIIRQVLELSGASNPGDFLAFLRWIDFGNLEKKMLAVQKKMDVFLQGLIDERRNGNKGSSDSIEGLRR
ncbi:Cytochrome P450 81Q32 [Camellia lanceoleosa]|uniref:Cytochrome P450 81Q32 n=1 Tax=Camellia lanceoleosa TaxID=1840588 RepID=A0ACC0HNC2_9ERIC|nr:Cytochrome P450 81Q32 [Camellia lanceoleosa]